MTVLSMQGMDQKEVMQQQAERYLSLLDALEECIELGVSMKSINTLIFETGADVSDIGHICNKLNLKGN